ncbi:MULTISPECIES: glycosyltransferase family 2 protein [unclassified Wenzhouxiangella]|uniref:glycosyltransferase family 2 protein n=1 Tax=unclassified Wenzhouxiangella TaxID=2613841 RepID=UPI000E32A25E|nr:MULTISPECIES: glycosyltransferase [unclassified Wenzhouxiangella]RFF26526.1 glycosyltransferase [Wenzhouxiangella sp. 15181]RFP67515.1 glycosyltransferase [Wenzhouxiangella sp. 15190]
MAQAVTAIVVPVFNAPEATRRCLASLTETIETRQPVIVIDDASTEPEIPELLDSQPRNWTRVRNESNLGFVASANLGMTLAAGQDVILLNADTRVTSGWLEAIERCAASGRDIASVTPLTNNGEIASIPTFCHPNPWPDAPERWAKACREAGPPLYPEVPTAVGFCMFLRRRAIDQIGLFDEAAYGRGYGEENDWCMRAARAGWRHVICDDAFVAHEGGASFGPLGLKPGGEAMETLLSRYPDYMERVRAFIEADPMAERRQKIVEAFRKANPSQ